MTLSYAIFYDFSITLITKITEVKHSIAKMIESLKKCTCTNVDQNYYLFDYYDEVLEDIGQAADIDFSTKIRTLQQIKKNISETKI
ncbi:hypothetical protein [Fusibacter tunisiensis]|uniref:hypothetical protein n=1 Tax=Fusibacter tunisiensis TaxID=1008308 RepID=UPI00195DA164|nr:hypothetical protein [Fusibacter tunisiensis]